jgi:DNA-binding NtrC family response regulator
VTKVLLTDDNEAVRFALALALKKAGFDVVEADNGDEVMARDDLDDIDVVVTDILMPGKDGIELLMELRERVPDLPVIAISGGGRVSSEDYLETASVMGAVAVFNKPFNEKLLIEKIESLVAA